MAKTVQEEWLEKERQSLAVEESMLERYDPPEQEVIKSLIEKARGYLVKIEMPTNDCKGCGNPIDHSYCDHCNKLWAS